MRPGPLLGQGIWAGRALPWCARLGGAGDGKRCKVQLNQVRVFSARSKPYGAVGSGNRSGSDVVFEV